MTKEELENKIAQEIQWGYKGDPIAWQDAKLAENNSFTGEGLNAEKHARLMRIMEICKTLPDYDADIENVFFPFSQESKNGFARIEFARNYFCPDNRVTEALAEAMTAADGFTLGRSDDGKIALTFVVNDMWDGEAEK